MASIHINRSFALPVQELYKAWTEPDQLKQWWKPMNKQLVEVENNVEEGGNIRYTFEDGLVIDGKYSSAQPQKQLEYSWNWNFTSAPVEEGHYKLQVKFSEQDGKSSIDITQEKEGSDEHIVPHQKGWEEGLQQLAEYLEKRSAATAIKEKDTAGKPDITGYNETPEQQKEGGA